MADDGRTETSGIPCQHTAGEKYPYVRPLTRAGNFQCSRHTQLFTGANYRACILAPISLIQIDGKKMARVILQLRIYTHCMATSEVIINHIIGQRAQQAVATVCTLDPGLFTDPGTPFVRTSGGIA